MKRIVWLMLLLIGCTQPLPSVTPAPTITLLPSATVASMATVSPTIINTPQPTLTAYQVDMYHSPTEQVMWRLDNPHHYCLLTNFDLTLEPGYIGVWRRDNGGYMECEARIAPKGSQP